MVRIGSANDVLRETTACGASRQEESQLQADLTAANNVIWELQNRTQIRAMASMFDLIADSNLVLGQMWRECRSMPSFDHRLTETGEHQSTSVSPHRSTEEVASCATVKILTHEEFPSKHPRPPKPFRIKKSDIDRHQDPAADRQPGSTDDRHISSSIDRQPPLTYRVQLPKIDVARLNELRNPSQPLEHMAENFEQLLDDAPESMQIDQTSETRTLRRRKEKVPKHLKREVNEKEIASPKEFSGFPWTSHLRRLTLPTACDCNYEDEYETKYSGSIDSETMPSIDIANHPPIDDKSIKSIDSSANATFTLPAHFYPCFDVATQPQTAIDYHYGDTISRQGDYSIGKQNSYNKAEIDESVAEIYEAIRTSDDYHSKRLDDIYYPFDNSIIWLTTRTDEMKQDITMLQNRHVVGAGRSTSIAAHAHTSIDDLHQNLLKEDVYQELKDMSETTYVRLGMQQRSIENLQHRMHASEVVRERLKNQWTRGDEAIRSFIGTWFQMSRDEVDTCIQPSGHFDHY
uniref:Uncharacterized protein n=1 Tax=Brassica campestris TaxID=3711 RepID=M4FGS9_BRACM